MKCPKFKDNDQLQAFHEKNQQSQRAKEEAEKELKRKEAEQPVFSLVQ